MTAPSIGHNQPPGAVDLARPTFDDLNKFLSDHPVIANEDESRVAKAVFDRGTLALKGIDEERDGKVRPLNQQVTAINGEYHRWHNTNQAKPGLWDTLLKELRIRLTKFARIEEDRRREAAEAAQRAKEEAERKAREAEQREREAQETAAAGVCDVDIGAASQDADDSFREFLRADRISQRAEKAMKVRIGGGFGKVSTLRTKETLSVTDWKAAIEEMSDEDGEIPAKIADAIIMCARAYRQVWERLPAGIERDTERTL